MAESAPPSDAHNDVLPKPDRAAPPGAPRWVKIAGFLVVVLIVVLVASKLAGVEHGPGSHSAGGSTPTSEATEDGAPTGASPAGHTPPAGIPDHGAPEP